MPDADDPRSLPPCNGCRHCRPLLVEMVLPKGDTPHPGKLLDMLMLSVPGGEERTPSQDSALLDKAGFKMTQVVPTQSLVGIVEAVPK